MKNVYKRFANQSEQLISEKILGHKMSSSWAPAESVADFISMAIGIIT